MGTSLFSAYSYPLHIIMSHYFVNNKTYEYSTDLYIEPSDLHRLNITSYQSLFNEVQIHKHEDCYQISLINLRQEIRQIIQDLLRSRQLPQEYVYWAKLFSQFDKLEDYDPFDDRYTDIVIYDRVQADRGHTPISSNIGNPLIKLLLLNYWVRQENGTDFVYFTTPLCVLDDELVMNIVQYFQSSFDRISVTALTKHDQVWFTSIKLQNPRFDLRATAGLTRISLLDLLLLESHKFNPLM
ncbi:hypothetical protein [Paenibacillus massiliensis]|uniref:hypothetical protein n=1 Tax=Paenibacillus massiliensis TaxID=225917 RepID=UPI0003FBCA5A|nr:hypothetical protein [Paenibacillus massiliensis]